MHIECPTCGAFFDEDENIHCPRCQTLPTSHRLVVAAEGLQSRTLLYRKQKQS